MANPNGNPQNLKTGRFAELPPEELRAISSKGGKNSAIKRAERIKTNELLTQMMNCKISKDVHAEYQYPIEPCRS